MTPTEERVAASAGAGAANQGVSSATTGVAGSESAEGIAGSQTTGTPPTGEAEKPRLVPEEDFKKLQRIFNQKIDAQREQIERAEQTLGQVQELLAKKDDEILQLRTANLPAEEAELERTKAERDRLKGQVDQAAKAFDFLQQKEARDQVMHIWLRGDESRGIEPHAPYGLTEEELRKCQGPHDMIYAAARAKQAWLQKEKEALEREKAAVAAQVRKDTGATKFDKGESTTGGGGNTRAKPGTAAFREYQQKVLSGEIRLRS